MEWSKAFAKFLVGATLILLGCSEGQDPLSVEDDLYASFDIVQYTPCPEDAPDCNEISDEEEGILRDAIDMIAVNAHPYCLAAKVRLENALDAGMVDVFPDYERFWMGQSSGHPRGNWDPITGRYSFNAAYLGGAESSPWNTGLDRLAATGVHEAGGHAAAGWRHPWDNDSIDGLEDLCIDW